MKKLFCLVITFSIVSLAFADNGMWTMDQIDKLKLNEKGLKIPIEEVYNPEGNSLYNAIVGLGGGTSEFVSPNGLILTNHHVAYGAVQRASTQGTDYLTFGFLAKSLNEEIQAFGTSAYLLKEMVDVTNEIVTASFHIKNLVQRQKVIDTKIKSMTDSIEAKGIDIKASIAASYHGKEYKLYIYKRFDDVRIVYMPPLGIGNYGGDIDNWMWPRHTGDFAYARVYVSPEGLGRKYHPDNVPYHPQKWLKISTRDLDDGDFTMVMGFPGRTTRYRTSHSVKYNLNYFYPEWLKTATDVISVLDEAGTESHEAQIAVIGQRKGIANYQKKYGGAVKSMDKYDFLKSTLNNESEFDKHVKSNRKLKKKYGKVIDEIGELYVELERNHKRDTMLDYLGGYWKFIGVLPRVADNIYGFAKEREKPENERDPNFSDKDVQRHKDRLHYTYMGYYEPAQKELLKYMLNRAVELPINSRIKGIDKILSMYNMNINEFVDYAFENTMLKGVEYAKTLYAFSSSQLEDLNDPFIQLAAILYPEMDEYETRSEKFDAVINDLRKKYIEGILIVSDNEIYPDANSTFRFTYGNVKGYIPRDAVQYSPFTSLSGAIEKDTGIQPFDMPKKLKELYLEKDYDNWVDPDLNDIPIAFLHTTDITNGNSGSPVLNAFGEMIGIVFDINLEAMLGDWKFDSAIQRTISVDIRYVMFITEKFAGADYLLEEMGVK